MSTPSFVTLYVEAPSGERFEADIPVDVRISKLAGDFFEAQGWPMQDRHGRGNRAVVELVDSENPDETKRLSGDLDIAEAGIQNGDLLRIFPESIAGCFLGNVPVVLGNRDEKQIQDIVVGDELLSYCLETRQYATTQVTNVFVGLADRYLLLNDSCGVTESHPFWSGGKWRQISELQVGDKLQEVDGGCQEIESLEWCDHRATVYNLRVASNDHSFYASNVLVHKQSLYIRR